MHFFNTDLNYLAKLDSSSEMNVVVFKMPHLDSTNDGRQLYYYLTNVPCCLSYFEYTYQVCTNIGTQFAPLPIQIIGDYDRTHVQFFRFSHEILPMEGVFLKYNFFNSVIGYFFLQQLRFLLPRVVSYVEHPLHINEYRVDIIIHKFQFISKFLFFSLNSIFEVIGQNMNLKAENLKRMSFKGIPRLSGNFFWTWSFQ